MHDKMKDEAVFEGTKEYTSVEAVQADVMALWANGKFPLFALDIEDGAVLVRRTDIDRIIVKEEK